MQLLLHSNATHIGRFSKHIARKPSARVAFAGQRRVGSYTVCSGRFAPLDTPAPGFDSIRSALDDIADGKFVVVLDDADRENEGDLIMAADKSTPEAMHFMVEHTSGVVCIGMPAAELDRLKLPLMVNSAENEEAMYTAFTVTVDVRHGTTTGISASDRAATLKALADPASTPGDFKRPGHIFPLRSQQQGVLIRPGHTEAAVDLSRLAGCSPAGVLCEIVDRRDGSMARTPQLLEFAQQHGLKCVTIADLIRYRMNHDAPVEYVGSRQVATQHGPATAHTFRCSLDGSEHVALVAGAVAGQQAVPTKVHTRSTVDDVFGDKLQGAQGGLDAAVRQAVGGQHGVVLYLQALTPTPTHQWCSSAELQALQRWSIAVRMLRHLEVGSVQLLQGDAADTAMLEAFGVDVVQPASNGASNGVGGSNGHQLHRSPASYAGTPTAAV
jgi:3,4-dihydroxy 2-butanone 4-phosphate synthase / GTP cyclohydrolase II